MLSYKKYLRVILENIEFSSREASILLKDINNMSKSIGTGGNNNEDGLGEHYRDKVSPCVEQVVHLPVSQAEKLLKKLDRDYQHTYKNYLETRSNRYSSYIKRRHSDYRSGQAGNCIIYYKKLRDKLQNDLEKLNKAEETQRRTEKPDYCKQFLMLHGCESLAQEKRMIHQIGETQQQQQQQPPENNVLGQKRIYFKQRNWEVKFSYTQSRIPSSSKGIHDLLRSFKDTEKLRNKTTASGELVDNQTSQDSLKTSIEILTKVIKRLGKETGSETMIDNGYEEKIKQLEKKCEWICGHWDEQKKYIAELKKLHEVSL